MREVKVVFDGRSAVRLLTFLRKSLDTYPNVGDSLIEPSNFVRKLFSVESGTTRTGNVRVALQLTDFGRGYFTALGAFKLNRGVVKRARHRVTSGATVGTRNLSLNQSKRNRKNKKNLQEKT